ncbi:MAG TPA: 50S ribosomal protein L9 [Treponemataceae bacterium]|nr:50S ribosomal protein L9 [Treponemataceae bacterium]
MKVILNDDVKHLGEMGDVKKVANGYARNFLFPRQLALPYNEQTIAYFEGKKDEIEKRKAEKRAASASLKERLEAKTFSTKMPAGPTGKLYGAVTNNTISELLKKEDFTIERKKISIPGLTIKQTGKSTVSVHLYEDQYANVEIEVIAEESKKDAAARIRAEKKDAAVAKKTKEKISKEELAETEEKVVNETEA